MKPYNRTLKADDATAAPGDGDFELGALVAGELAGDETA
jgi:hypothetical protein